MNLNLDINRLYQIIGQKIIENDALTSHISELLIEIKRLKDTYESVKQEVKKNG